MGDASRIRTIVWRGGLQALALLAAAGLLWRGRGVLALAAVAAVLASAASVPVGALERWGVRRGLAILIVLGGTLVAGLAVLAAVAPVVAEQVQAFAAAVPDLVARVRGSHAFAWVEQHLDRTGRGSSVFERSATTVAGVVIGAVEGTASAGAGAVVVFAITGFLLGSGPALWRSALQWVHPARRPRVERVAADVRRAVASYVAGALVMATIAGTVTAVTTLLLGVPYWLPLAVVTAALGIVPFLGAIVSGALVTGATFLTAGTTAGLVALGVFLAYQQLEGTVLQPVVQRRTIELNPLVVLGAGLLGAAAGGLFGGVLALPFAAAAKVVAGDALERRRARWRRAALRDARGPAADPTRPRPPAQDA